MAETWTCAGCGSMNSRDAAHCGRCNLLRTEAPVTVTTLASVAHTAEVEEHEDGDRQVGFFLEAIADELKGFDAYPGADDLVRYAGRRLRSLAAVIEREFAAQVGAAFASAPIGTSCTCGSTKYALDGKPGLRWATCGTPVGQPCLLQRESADAVMWQSRERNARGEWMGWQSHLTKEQRDRYVVWLLDHRMAPQDVQVRDLGVIAGVSEAGELPAEDFTRPLADGEAWEMRHPKDPRLHWVTASNLIEGRPGARLLDTWFHDGWTVQRVKCVGVTAVVWPPSAGREDATPDHFPASPSEV